MISKLVLKNFRCFQDFSLDGIRPVTLIAGANNVGKSTILDAIFLFIDRNSSDVFLKLNSFRGVQQLNLSPKMVWEPLFANMDTEKSISIAVSNDDKTQTVTIGKDDSYSLSSLSENPTPLNSVGVGTTISNSYPLKLTYKDINKSYISHFILTEKGISISSQKLNNTITPFTQYLSSRINITPIQLAEWFGKLDMEGKRSKCVEVLQILEPRIKDMSVVVIGGISGIYADLGLSSKLSINMLGDGTNKLMYIVLTLLANPGSIVLLDEIENGFHYSFYPKLWEIIGKLAEDTKCQIFATTHSYECIRGALPLAANGTDSFRFIRLDKADGKILSHSFDNDSFEYSLNNEWEVR